MDGDARSKEVERRNARRTQYRPMDVSAVSLFFFPLGLVD
jgi:hypothetical protein